MSSDRPTHPLVSVIIPAYNAEKFIAETLESVLAQTYRNLEILVVDDGSSDSTVDLVKHYQKQDARITLIRQKNAGVAAARNTGIEQSQGEFIAPIDSDDIWFPKFIETLLNFITSEPDIGMVYCWSIFIDEKSRLMKVCQSGTWEGEDYIPLIYRNFPGNASCVLIRRHCLEQVGAYDPSYRALNAQGCEDWDLYMRLAENFKVRVAPHLLVGYRQTLGSMSSSPEPMRLGSDLILERVAKRHPEFHPSLYRWHKSNFAWYLALKCSRHGNHPGAIAYMKKALSLDYFPLVRVSFYKLWITSHLKVLFHPLTKKIWPDHLAWLTFKDDLWAAVTRILPWRTQPSLTRLQRQQEISKNYFPWRQYEDFLNWRCQRIHTQAQKLLQSLATTQNPTTHFPAELDRSNYPSFLQPQGDSQEP